MNVNKETLLILSVLALLSIAVMPVSAVTHWYDEIHMPLDLEECESSPRGGSPGRRPDFVQWTIVECIKDTGGTGKIFVYITNEDTGLWIYSKVFTQGQYGTYVNSNHLKIRVHFSNTNSYCGNNCGIHLHADLDWVNY